jgi:acetolactate synthase-1/2/3 large subunit
MSNQPVNPALLAPGLKFSGTVAHLVAECLQRHGVEYLFGQSLPSMLHLACEQMGLKQVAYRSENAGGYMADGYARISNLPGIVTAQNGPAATLLVAPLAEALKASVPLIALVQDVNRSETDRNAFQEFDHITLFASCTKWVRRVTEASRVEDYIDQAFVAACSGVPGPVALMLPADLLLEAAPKSKRLNALGYFPLDRTVPVRSDLKIAADLIAKAKNPLIIVGGGVHLSGSQIALSQLQEKAHLPIATTVMGKGSVDEQHPLSVGVIGYFMGPNGNTHFQKDLVSNADVIVLIGTRTNQNGTDSWKLYPPTAKYIHIDANGNEVGRNYEATRLVGDARETILALTEELLSLDLAIRKDTRQLLEKKIQEGRNAYLEQSKSIRQSNSIPIRPERVMEELNQVLTSNSVVISDASYASVWSANYLTSLFAGMRFLAPRGLAGIGWGFPMALGAKVAKPTADVYCVVGDGGFAHVWSEQETAVRMNLKVVLIVLNNGILGFQKHAENIKYGLHTSAVHFAPVDHAAIARACGCQGITVTKPEELGPALELAKAAKTTTVIDVICDENAFPPLSLYHP